MPVAQTSMSRAPTCAAASSSEAGEVMSTWRAPSRSASSRRKVSRARETTSAPSRFRACAMAAPRPPVAPSTATRFPTKLRPVVTLGRRNLATTAAPRITPPTQNMVSPATAITVAAITRCAAGRGKNGVAVIATTHMGNDAMISAHARMRTGRLTFTPRPTRFDHARRAGRSPRARGAPGRRRRGTGRNVRPPGASRRACSPVHSRSQCIERTAGSQWDARWRRPLPPSGDAVWRAPWHPYAEQRNVTSRCYTHGMLIVRRRRLAASSVGGTG